MKQGGDGLPASSRGMMPFLEGARACVGVPAIGIFMTMLGYGVMARDGGLSAFQAAVSTVAVWGISGQVAMVEMLGAGSDVLAICVAAGLVNLRMLPIAISGLPMILAGRKLILPLKLILVQTTSVTGWTHAQTIMLEQVAPEDRLLHYVGFSATLVSSAIAGTIAGHVAGGGAPPMVMTVAVFLTPLYLYLLVASARQKINQLSVIFGSLFGLAFYPAIGDWSVAAAGVVGGSLAFAAARKSRQ